MTLAIMLLMLILTATTTAVLATECIPAQHPHGFTCLCTSEACDSIAPLNFTNKNNAVVYQTAKEIGDEVGDRLRRFELPFTTLPDAHPAARRITLDTSTTYQTIRGFGNALTDAASIQYDNMKNKSIFLEQYWGNSGLGLALGRVPIASCDFSTSSWSYDDTNNDYTLEHFSIKHDEMYKIPFIKDVLQKAYQSAQPLELFASPWAPSYWMTTTNTTLRNPVLREDSNIPQIYADYLVEFFRQYSLLHDIHFWAMTSQNEPAGNTGTWQGLTFTPETQRDFIKDILGPTLKKNNVTANLQLMMLDDQRSHLNKWTDVVLSDPKASSFIQGIGFHWYASVEDEFPHFDQMSDVHAKYGHDTFLLGTEACEGYLPWSQGPLLGSFERGETYAHDILQDLNHWAVGWTDWNAVLNMRGGPNWAGNVVSHIYREKKTCFHYILDVFLNF